MQTTAPENLPLLDILAKMAPDSSKTTLRSWVKEGRVAIDGAPAKRADIQVAQGQQVSLLAKPRYAEGNIRLLFEDSHLVVIEKPTGMLSVSTAFQKEQTAHGWLKKHYRPRKVYVVHRLDQETSGVMLFALSEKGYEGMKNLFATHAIDRTYVAVVEGRLPQKTGIWSSYLYEDSRYMVHSTQDPALGVQAITHYKVESESSRYSLLRLSLETGKKNQIRIHCRDAGCPIAGDAKYGAQTDPINRLCLHAELLGFVHPVTEKPMRFVQPAPHSFYSLLGIRKEA